MLRNYFRNGDRLVLKEAPEGRSPIWIDLLKPSYDEDRQKPYLASRSLRAKRCRRSKCRRASTARAAQSS